MHNSNTSTVYKTSNKLLILLSIISISILSCTNNDNAVNDNTKNESTSQEVTTPIESKKDTLLYDNLEETIQNVYAEKGLEGLKQWLNEEITDGRIISPYEGCEDSAEMEKIYDKCILSIKDRQLSDTIVPYTRPIDKCDLLPGFNVSSNNGETNDFQVQIEVYKH